MNGFGQSAVILACSFTPRKLAQKHAIFWLTCFSSNINAWWPIYCNGNPKHFGSCIYSLWRKKNTSILKSMIIVGGGRKQLAVYDVLICETLAINIPSLALSVVDLLDLWQYQQCLRSNTVGSVDPGLTWFGRAYSVPLLCSN